MKNFFSENFSMLLTVEIVGLVCKSCKSCGAWVGKWVYSKIVMQKFLKFAWFVVAGLWDPNYKFKCFLRGIHTPLFTIYMVRGMNAW